MPRPAKIVFASGNNDKLREINALLHKLSIQVVPQAAFDVSEVEETGLSFVENAIIKARHAAEITRLPTIADDSGIEVDVLDGAPGIYSARYAGAGAGDEDNLQLLLHNIAATEKPRARFRCAMVYMRSATDPAPLIAQGTWEGYLIKEVKGQNGFGYDPIFYVPTHACTAAELPAAEKNQLSHRGQALRQLLQALAKLQ